MSRLGLEKSNAMGAAEAGLAGESASAELSGAAVEAWLVKSVSDRTGISTGEIELDDPFTRSGMDSVAALELVAEIEDFYGVVVPDTAVWSHPNIRSLATLVVALGAGKKCKA